MVPIAAGEPVHVDVEREHGVRVTACRGGLDLLHVAGSGQRGEPGALLQRRGDLVRVQVLVLLEPEDQPRVDACRIGWP